jgi:hypothetical protein
MNAHERDAIERACTRLIHEYAWLNDQRDFEALAALFTADAELYRPSAPERAIVGRAAILAAFRMRPADTITFHVCSDVLIDVKDDGAVSSRSRILMLAGNRAAPGNPIPNEPRAPVPGVFHDRFEWTDAGWRFAQRRGAFWMPVREGEQA